MSNSDRPVRVAVFILAHLETAQVMLYRDCMTRKMRQKRSGTVALAPSNICLILQLGFAVIMRNRARGVRDRRQQVDTVVD